MTTTIREHQQTLSTTTLAPPTSLPADVSGAGQWHDGPVKGPMASPLFDGLREVKTRVEVEMSGCARSVRCILTRVYRLSEESLGTELTSCNNDILADTRPPAPPPPRVLRMTAT